MPEESFLQGQQESGPLALFYALIHFVFLRQQVERKMQLEAP
jgi:hypothetical protein